MVSNYSHSHTTAINSPFQRLISGKSSVGPQLKKLALSFHCPVLLYPVPAPNDQHFLDPTFDESGSSFPKLDCPV